AMSVRATACRAKDSALRMCESTFRFLSWDPVCGPYRPERVVLSAMSPPTVLLRVRTPDMERRVLDGDAPFTLRGGGEGLAVPGNLGPELPGRKLRFADRLRADVVDLLGEGGELLGGLSASHLGAEVRARLHGFGHGGRRTLRLSRRLLLAARRGQSIGEACDLVAAEPGGVAEVA